MGGGAVAMAMELETIHDKATRFVQPHKALDTCPAILRGL